MDEKIKQQIDVVAGPVFDDDGNTSLVKERITQIIEESTEQIFTTIVKEYGLQSGDIEPMHKVRLGQLEMELSHIVYCFYKGNKN